MPHLGQAFGVVAGLSDHTHGTATSVASIALGGSVIEKHFTLARADGGPDAAFSLEPDEFKRLCEDCHSAWVSLGDVSYRRKPAEEQNMVFRRSLYAVADIAEGAVLTRDNVRSIRPGYGLQPLELDNVLGRPARKAISRGTPLSWDLLR